MVSPRAGPEPIAIIGSSCRFPGGASSPSKLWELLRDPRDLLSDIPSSCFNAKAFYHSDPEHHGCSNVTTSYMLDEDSRVFDHNFFNISPKEAESTDPQHRVLLETVYEGIESAGYSLQQLKGSATAVFVGQMTADYYDVLARDFDSIPQYMSTGTSRCLTSNKVSYFFDWKGPSVTIDTACSSSLVAVHQAIQELRHGESKLAVAAGVNLILGPENYIHESKLHMLSPTGRSRMWDAKADGYARGEGSAAVVLKLLHQAIADGDDIESVIRETGVNQDGRTAGITVPSVSSQTALIRSTYERCGLDCSVEEDRCQYFEAHGTGTLAGDPVEAEAVRNAFFGNPRDGEYAANISPSAAKLHVGSIKTVIGHLEGAAGLAGLLKASLAVQHGFIPANMHFDQLNPAIEPFYHQLCIPTKATLWPGLPQGVPRRASVNSFGFGGTNCHAIIESWKTAKCVQSLDTFPYGPFIMSANSESALSSAVAALAETLKQHEESQISLADLAFTLQMRRTVLPFKTSFSATTSIELIAKLNSVSSKSAAGNNEPSWSTAPVHVTESLPPRILGIFTGQGAQWPTMGAALYEKSAAFRNTMQSLERSLVCLPNPPDWFLSSELLAPTETSRVHEAAICQPLCTALQICLVDLLKACGIAFQGVVGHSSGEIAAVYAAGYINAHDAIRIAYYRGLHAEALQSRERPGRMMAVGMSFENARQFCQKDQFLGRIVVAASNSRSGTTLSGDADAIEEAKVLLDADQIFSRILNVDKAYHSWHMESCSEAYLKSLHQCDIAIQSEEQNNCKWFSSVYGPDGRSVNDRAALRGQYWVKNLSQPVLFSQALDRAVTESYCYDIVLEVGPHAALKSPATETLKTLTGIDLPYIGILSRGENEMNTFSDALGFLWKSFQTSYPLIDFQAFRRACIGEEKAHQVSIVKGLPTYSWDHEKPLWKESRISKLYRERKDPHHELLGTAMSDGNMKEVRWRNIMRLREMDWLRGHQFQGQVLFPAAGYISMAVEASVRLVRGGQDAAVQFIELEDLVIHEAITIEDDSPGTDVRFVIRVTERSSNMITADYTCYSAGVDASSWDTEKVNFTGRAILTLATSAEPFALPARESPRLPLSELDVSRFYASLEKIGLKYSGDFLIESASRRLDTANVNVRHISSPLLVHPATLDAAFQGVFAAYCFPGDGRLQTGHLPTNIERVRVDVSACQYPPSNQTSELFHTADCYVRSTSGDKISGDVSVFLGAKHRPEMQIEGLTCTSLERSLAQNDRKIFARTIWMPDVAQDVLPEAPSSTEDRELAEIIERVVYFYLRKLQREISPEEIPQMDKHFQYLMSWALDHVLPRIEIGLYPRVKAAWKDDTPEMIASWKSRYRGKIDMDLITALGEALPSVCRGILPTLQVLMENDMLNRFYKEGLGFLQANFHLASLVSRFSHRYPHIKVLEIGAGTGGATAHVLKALSPQFESYTYTDISPGFFENARSLFHEHLHKMTFKTLDVERDPSEQGYQDESFDLIIASNVLHATKALTNTLRNCRRLLRPGGQLLLMEITSAEETIRLGFITAGLPGWWLGRDDGRIHAPTISESQWNLVLAGNGFSGVDVARRDFEKGHYNTVMATQAVDDRVTLLRQPLSTVQSPSEPITSLVPRINNLILVGGIKAASNAILRAITKLLQPFAAGILTVDALEHLSTDALTPGTVTLCLADLDGPIWRDMTEMKFNGLKKLFLGSSHILWVTQGRLADEPYSNMTVGVGRSLLLESPHVSLQFLDFDSVGAAGFEAVSLAEHVLRMICLSSPGFEELLWSFEHELCIKEGRAYIPRILPDDDLNARLNSQRRPIERDFSILTSCIEVAQRNKQIALLESEPHTNCAGAHSSCEDRLVRVHVSSLFPFSTRDHQSFFICIGSQLHSDERLLFLSQSNASLVCVPRDQRLKWNSGFSDEEALNEVLSHLVAENLSFEVEGSLWVHEPDDRLAKCLTHCSENRELGVFLSTARSRIDPLRRFIHPRTAGRHLASILPSDLTRFANADYKNGREFDKIFKSLYKDGCADAQSLMRNVGGRRNVILQFSRHAILDRLSKICLHVSSRHIQSCEGDLSTELTMIQDVNELSHEDKGPAHVITWKSEVTVSALVRSLEMASLFSANKTYLLVGLTGEVGLSLCNWMVKKGARHLVITSRSPDIHSALLEDLERRGARVRVFALDISDRMALDKVYSEICNTMPPIAGVANAAMVLSDKVFENTTLDNFNAVLAPKVQGSKNLDDLFFSAELEFFVLFSSIASVVGSKGQSNYGAANLFMHSLAQQRRGRGVAASVMDIAMLLGIGYVARSLDQYESQMKQYSYMAISEPEFHDIFAAAILSGKPRSSHSPEVITGIGYDADAPWTLDPRFSHFVCHEQKFGEIAQTVHSSINILGQLAQSNTNIEALGVIEVAFSKKVELMLQLAAGSIDVQAPLVQMGIDSLVAVELRSWFLKEFNIDMPVLKFLNGASASDICMDALARLSELSRTRGATEDNREDQSSSVSKTGGQFSCQSSPAESEPGTDTPVSSCTSTTTPDNEPENINLETSAYERVGPMSIGQTRLFFLQEYSQKKSAYTVIMLGKAQKKVNVPKLQKALDDVSRKHESLRSAFFIDESSGQFVQAVTATSGITLEHKIVTGPDELAAVVETHKTFEFDLARGQTIKFLVLTESPTTQYILICYHHIVLDGFSAIMFLKDLDEAYSGRRLVPPEQQAIDLCVKQQLDRLPSNLPGELQFWSMIHRKTLKPLPLMPFAKVRNRKILRTFDVVWHDVIFDVQITKRVKVLGTKLNVTPFHIYLSTLAAFLSRCLNIDELNIGVMDSNRVDTEDLETFGYFMNFLPLRFSMQPKSTFGSLARQTRDTIYAALANSRAPLAAIIDHLNVPRSGTHHPLFQVAINYRQDNSTRSKFGDIPIEWIDGTNLGYPYDMKFDVNDTPDGTRLCLVTQRYLYGALDAKRMVRWYQAALTAFLSDPNISIGSYPLSSQTDEDNNIALVEGPRTTVDWYHHSLAHRVQEMATLYPDSVAVKESSGQHLTYSEMMARSENIAAALHSMIGDRPGARVAVLLTAVPDLACSLLAIMRLGLVFVPMDTRSSVERLGAIVSDCQPSIILCHRSTEAQAGHLATGGIQTTNIENLENHDLLDSESTTIPTAADQAGFVTYTNGTTEAPKGVLLTHAGVMNQIWGITTRFGVGREVVLQSASPESDISLEQMLISLANGGTLVILPQESIGDAGKVANIMLSEGITYTGFTASEYVDIVNHGTTVLRECTSWRFAFSSRESVTARLRRAFRHLDLAKLELISGYGSAETSISCIRIRLDYKNPCEDASDDIGENISGHAMPNYSLVIVDQDLRPLPIGYPGEICVAGPGLAKGYLNRPVEQARTFIDNPFASPHDVRRGCAKLFRSGDKGRVLEDGSVHFIGRLEGGRQATIRGTEVDLDEVANVIVREASPDILDAAVSWREEPGVLVAFVTLAHDFAGDMEMSFGRLKSTLPLSTYMIPELFIPVHSFLKTLNGSKDLHAIDKLLIPVTIPDRMATSLFSPLEARVKIIWEGILAASEMANLNPESDFFSAGGSSLLVIRLQAALRAELGCDPSLPDLFQFSTIRSMASCIQGRATDVKSLLLGCELVE
ncbi:hypothetical protein N8I77_005380 [Diaporthe amygdali]|uniref:Uncharacterized protein n=1 Tax=Phomopsis amygdali TaxID=1214568 RepID=A0AAD9SEG5_PHOAM|nr:hypothetical protein N8I77_005380 [Diaporthe amygdali]